jgi:hypothetical protein
VAVRVNQADVIERQAHVERQAQDECAGKATGIT